MFIRKNNKSKILELPYHKIILDISSENNDYYNVKIMNNKNVLLCYFYEKIDKTENFIESHRQKIDKSLNDIKERMNVVIEKLSKFKVIDKVPEICRAFRSVEYNNVTLISYTKSGDYKILETPYYKIKFKKRNEENKKHYDIILTDNNNIFLEAFFC